MRDFQSLSFKTITNAGEVTTETATTNESALDLLRSVMNTMVSVIKIGGNSSEMKELKDLCEFMLEDMDNLILDQIDREKELD